MRRARALALPRMLQTREGVLSMLKLDEFNAVVCRRRQSRRTCEFCGQRATLRCDRRQEGKMCDAYICERCAKPISKNRDVCPRHAR